MTINSVPLNEEATVQSTLKADCTSEGMTATKAKSRPDVGDVQHGFLEIVCVCNLNKAAVILETPAMSC